MSVQEPARFVAVHGAHDMVRCLREALAPLVPALVPPLRQLLATREPTCMASACLVLSDMLHHGGPAFCTALVPHFWQFGQCLNLLLSNAAIHVSAGYNSRTRICVAKLVHHMLAQIQEGGGAKAGQLLQRYTPLYSPPVIGTEAVGRRSTCVLHAV